MDDDVKFNSNGTDALYLAKVNTFFTALFALTVFQKGWPEEKLGSESALKKCTDWFREMFEGGRTGNRIQIAARKSARQDLDVRIRKILHYLTVMADESDMTVLINSGVVERKTRKRARRTAKPVVAN